MVSDGNKSCAISTEGRRMECQNWPLSPCKLPTMRLPTSKISLRRSLKNLSSILSKEAASSCKVWKMAACADMCSFLILDMAASLSMGSCKIILCMDIRLAYSPPSVWRSFFSLSSRSERVFSSARLNLAISAFTSAASTYWLATAKSAVGKRTAGPMVTPGLAAMPLMTNINIPR